MNAGKKRQRGPGVQIRTYVLYPYQLVRDHRTGVETTRTRDVLNGEIDKFIEASIRLRAGKARRL